MMIYPGGGYPGLYWPPVGPAVGEIHDFEVVIVTDEEFATAVVTEAAASAAVATEALVTAAVDTGVFAQVAVVPHPPEWVLDFDVALVRGVAQTLVMVTTTARSAPMLTVQKRAASLARQVTISGLLIETVHEALPHEDVLVGVGGPGDWKVER